jgi:2-polyprenyl-3-methyl-5-hydroxy-6-metoxy-1,4-benzoquinol methylase
MLHHLSDPYQVIRELMRVMAPGGKLVLSDFTDEGFAMMERIHAMQGGTHDAGKARIPDIQKYMTAHGLDVKRAQTQFQEVLIAHKAKQ